MATAMRLSTIMVQAGLATPASTATPVREKEADETTLCVSPPPRLARPMASSSRLGLTGSPRRRAKVEQMLKTCT